MNKYDFSNLNDKEFEQFVGDLLSKELNIELQDFKIGRDKGIDLRFSSVNNSNSTIVQAKHYINSKFAQLIHNLENSELTKVKQLKPDNYYVVTSLPLTAPEKDKIYNLFCEFMESANSVYSQQDLNRILERNHDVEKKWFKLWMTSTNVLTNILHNEVYGRSSFNVSEIKRQIKLFVKNSNFDSAVEILTKNNCLLITGQPGVGKTTLSKILALYYLQEGYELIYIDSTVKEAEKVYSNNFDSKQLFYFDDFLGSNYYEITNAAKSESSLVNFIKRVSVSENKLFILSSRTSIYKSALHYMEKFERIKLMLANIELTLSDYSQFDKALILYNHLYFSESIELFRNQVFKNRNYWKIINHKNYTPRLIEYFTDINRLKNISPSEYMTYVLNQLDHPGEIWKYAFNSQISDEDKCLVLTIYSFDSGRWTQTIQEVFEKRLSYEIKKRNITISSDSFINSVKKMMDSFITYGDNWLEKTKEYRLINPSLGDFLGEYLLNDSTARWDIIYNIIYIEQIEKMVNFYNSNLHLLLHDRNKLLGFVFDKIGDFKLSKINGQEDPDITLTVAIVYEIFRLLDNGNEDILKICIGKIDNIEFDKLHYSTAENLLRILEYGYEFDEFKNYIINSYTKYVSPLIDSLSSFNEFDNLIELLEKYDLKYDKLLYEFYVVISNKVQELAKDDIDEYISSIKTKVHSIAEFEIFLDKIQAFITDLFNTYSLPESDYFDKFIEYLDPDELIDENAAKMRRFKNLYVKEKEFQNSKQSELIDELFINFE